LSVMKDMLSVVMDGIKDGEMLAKYAEMAIEHKADKGITNWFISRAQNRASMAERDWHDVHEHIKAEKHDEEMVEALECHVDRWLENLKDRVSRL